MIVSLKRVTETELSIKYKIEHCVETYDVRVLCFVFKVI